MMKKFLKILRKNPVHVLEKETVYEKIMKTKKI